MTQQFDELADLLAPVVAEAAPAARPRAKDKHFEKSPLNCLRCRHCEVRPETDFSKALRLDARGLGVANPEAIIPIYCAKTKRLRPAHIFTACAIADGRYHAACNAVRSKNTNSSPLGDRCKYLSGPERVFLRLHWPLGDIGVLKQVTGRSATHLSRMARKYEFPERSRLAILEGVKIGLTIGRQKVTAPRFTPEQSLFVLNCFESGHWPRKGNNPAIHERNREVKAEILEHVAHLGHQFSWDSISAHAHEAQPGAKRWRKQWDHSKRRRGRFVLPDGRPAPKQSQKETK